jgi:hypothetical protein
MYLAAWRHGTTCGCKLEGRLKDLDADMQQPTMCREDESHALEKGRPARGLRIGQSCGGEARGGGEEGIGCVGDAARLRKDTRKNPLS